MKQILLLVAVLATLSCNKLDKGVLFSWPIPQLEFTIPAGLNIAQAYYFNLENVPTNALGLLSTYSVDSSQVQSITPATARITSIFGNVSYDFLFEVSIMLCEPGDSSPNCGYEIFYRVPIPEGTGAFLDLIPNQNDIKDLLLQETVNIQVKLAQLRAPSPQFVESRMELTFNVK
ncbi:MAG: hypothetical protein KDC30_00970 [Saprospiraceae bacterium]|nr:hypothetical protein [Saprospiraceae bacterium]